MINNVVIVNNFKDFYYLEEGILDRMKDVKNSVVYFAKKFYLLLKSKNKKQELIKILKEMKQDYKEYYQGFINDIYYVIYKAKGQLKQNKKLRRDVIIFFMVVLSFMMVIPSVKILSSIMSPEELMKKIMENNEKIEIEVKNIQTEVEKENIPKLDLQDLGGGIRYDPTK